jgi:hypothetical protein
MVFIETDPINIIRDLRQRTPVVQISVAEWRWIIGNEKLTDTDKLVWFALAALTQNHSEYVCAFNFNELIQSVSKSCSMTYVALLHLVELGYCELDINELNLSVPYYLLRTFKHNVRLNAFDNSAMGTFLERRINNTIFCRLILPKDEAMQLWQDEMAIERKLPENGKPIMVNLMKNKV